MSKATHLRQVLDSGIVAVVRAPESGELVEVVRALADGGVTVVEITFSVPNALEVLRDVRKALGDDPPRRRRKRAVTPDAVRSERLILRVHPDLLEMLEASSANIIATQVAVRNFDDHRPVCFLGLEKVGRRVRREADFTFIRSPSKGICE